MGLFQKQDDTKKTSEEAMIAAEEHFFDEYFREELRNRGRWYFEKVINENGELFRHDLEETVRNINLELKEHVAKQLDSAIKQVNAELKEHTTTQLQAQFTEYSKTLKDAQDDALKGIVESTKTLEAQHRELSKALEKNVADQQSILHATFDENKAQIVAMKDAQDAALKWLNQSAQALHDQYKQLSATLQKNVDEQQQQLVDAFQQNMASIIEQYVVGALGDEYDLQQQLPAIIKQMEQNKQAIVDDMQL